MLSKKTLKQLSELKHARERKAQGLFTVEGSKLVAELLDSEFLTEVIYVTERWIEANNVVFPEHIPVGMLSGSEMERISNLTTPPGILAVARIRNFDTVPAVVPAEWTLVLDGISDPGNLGTILRTAEWFGIRTIFCSEKTVDVYNPKVVQSSMGSVFRVLVMETDLNELLKNAVHSGVVVVGALMDGRQPDVQLKNKAGGILLLGSESHGISPELMPHITHPVTISRFPDLGQDMPESLNAAVAAGILMYFLRSSS
jgi:TrmH family RNA methyltransferase